MRNRLERTAEIFVLLAGIGAAGGSIAWVVFNFLYPERGLDPSKWVTVGTSFGAAAGIGYAVSNWLAY
jgi:hypothetical protein